MVVVAMAVVVTGSGSHMLPECQINFVSVFILKLVKYSLVKSV